MADLEARYKTEMTERERASLEAQIWSLLPKEDRPEKRGLAGYMQVKLNASSTKARNRQFLQRAGSAADPLWERVERDMTLTTAHKIMQDAYDRRASLSVANKGSLTSEALHDSVIFCIAEYDQNECASRTPDGKVVRRRKASALPDAPPEVDVPTGRDFWPFFRSITAQYIRVRLEDCDQLQQDVILQKFEVDLNVLIADIQKEIRRVPKGTLQTLTFSRQRVLHECRILGIDPPKPGKPVDEKLLKLQYKRAMRAYHPDVHGGSEETRPQYESAIKAHGFLSDYNGNLMTPTVIARAGNPIPDSPTPEPVPTPAPTQPNIDCLKGEGEGADHVQEG